VDELYDGPFCVLSAVDNRSFRRLAYEVLDAGHSPTQEDVRSFLARLKGELDRRGLAVKGVTTDGSELYPAPLAEVFARAPHQVCRFHALKAITKAVLAAVGKVRGELSRRVPRLSRGRTAKHDKPRRAATRKAGRLRRRVADLYEHRHLFVRRGPSRAQLRTLRRISRGLPHLRALRGIMDEVYRLFDRRCRAETALRKLAALRRRARRFKRLGRALDRLRSPALEKALTFLDDKLLPSTSNAVERGNRRHRKMQKVVYSVRTRQHVRQRIALDLLREMNTTDRRSTVDSLHRARSAV
jgi:hypothetical protein